MCHSIFGLPIFGFSCCSSQNYVGVLYILYFCHQNLASCECSLGFLGKTVAIISKNAKISCMYILGHWNRLELIRIHIQKSIILMASDFPLGKIEAITTHIFFCYVNHNLSPNYNSYLMTITPFVYILFWNILHRCYKWGYRILVYHYFIY